MRLLSAPTPPAWCTRPRAGYSEDNEGAARGHGELCRMSTGPERQGQPFFLEEGPEAVPLPTSEAPPLQPHMQGQTPPQSCNPEGTPASPIPPACLPNPAHALPQAACPGRALSQCQCPPPWRQSHLQRPTVLGVNLTADLSAVWCALIQVVQLSNL